MGVRACYRRGLPTRWRIRSRMGFPRTTRRLRLGLSSSLPTFSGVCPAHFLSSPLKGSIASMDNINTLLNLLNPRHPQSPTLFPAVFLPLIHTRPSFLKPRTLNRVGQPAFTDCRAAPGGDGGCGYVSWVTAWPWMSIAIFVVGSMSCCGFAAARIRYKTLGRWFCVGDYCGGKVRCASPTPYALSP